MKFISTRLAVAVVSVLVLLLAPVKAQRTTTITLTESSTTTSVVTSTTNIVCAKLVNVTGACRRRRGFPIDEPVILTFDDDLDASIDEVFHPVLHPQFVPTRTLGVEVTPVVVLPVVHLAESDYPLMDGGYAQHPRFSSPSALVVRPSKSNNYSGRNKADSAKPRIYFSEINAFLNSIRSNLLGSTVSITVTITNVFTQTSTNIIRSSGSFFVMSCTPSPFPFTTCAAKRSLSPD